MDKKLLSLGFTPIFNFEAGYSIFYLCKYKKCYVMIFHLDDTIKQWKMHTLDNCNVIDKRIINNFKDTDFACMTNYGIYFKDEHYFFKNFSPEIKGLFEPCLMMHASSLPLDIPDVQNPLLSALYQSGLYQQLEKSESYFEIYVPNKIDKVTPDIIMTHIKNSMMDMTYGGVDTGNLIILDEKEIRNIKFNFIDHALSTEEILFDEVQIDPDIFIIEDIPKSMREINLYKEMYDEEAKIYRDEVDMLDDL